MKYSAINSLIEHSLYVLKIVIEPDPFKDAWHNNETFSMQPYSWDEDENEENPIPNFLYKPTGYQVNWYKHIGRGMEFEEIDQKEWIKIFKHCLNSLEEQ